MKVVPSGGRDVNHVPWIHEAEDRGLQCLSSQPLYDTAQVSDDVQTPQGGECNLPYSDEHS